MKILFMGSKTLGLRIVKKVFEQIIHPHIFSGIICPNENADKRSILSEFRTYSQEKNIPLYTAQNKKDADAILEKIRPDVVLVCGWYNLIAVNTFPEISFFGFHASPLPKYRGNAPLVWQIINGEPQIGISIFRIREGLDDGEILQQAYFLLEVYENIQNVLDKIEILYSSMTEMILPHILENRLQVTQQDNSDASYCGLRVPEDGRIPWDSTAVQVHNFIRAQSEPYPGAFSISSEGKRVYFWKSEVDNRLFYGTPGAVLERNRKYCVIKCGEGAIRIIKASNDTNETSVFTVFNSLKMRFLI